MATAQGWTWIEAGLAVGLPRKELAAATENASGWDGRFSGDCPGCQGEAVWNALALEVACACFAERDGCD